MFEKLRPLGDRVLVKRMETEEKTGAGIIIPDAAKEKAQTGTVLAVGPGKKNTNGSVVPLEVQVGDVIYFSKYSGNEAGEDYLIIREEDVLGVVR
ncbi:MAG: co-chaperone GroES [Candidatus Babeliales bacterium]